MRLRVPETYPQIPSNLGVHVSRYSHVETVFRYSHSVDEVVADLSQKSGDLTVDTDDPRHTWNHLQHLGRCQHNKDLKGCEKCVLCVKGRMDVVWTGVLESERVWVRLRCGRGYTQSISASAAIRTRNRATEYRVQRVQGTEQEQ